MPAPTSSTERFPNFMEVVKTFKKACNHVISCKTVQTSDAPIFHAHVFIDRREYLASFVPTDLDGPDCK